MHLQCGEHVTRGDAVNPNASTCPLNRQTRRQMADSSLRCVVRSLRLRNIDNSTRHAANHDNAPGHLPLHEVLGHSYSIQVGTVNIDSPKLLYAVMRVGDGVVVLCEARRRDEVVDLAVRLEDLGEGLVDGCWARDVAEVCCDLRDAGCALVEVTSDESEHLTCWTRGSHS
jgi:hypothetical protein